MVTEMEKRVVVLFAITMIVVFIMTFVVGYVAVTEMKIAEATEANRQSIDSVTANYQTISNILTECGDKIACLENGHNFCYSARAFQHLDGATGLIIYKTCSRCLKEEAIAYVSISKGEEKMYLFTDFESLTHLEVP